MELLVLSGKNRRLKCDKGVSLEEIPARNRVDKEERLNSKPYNEVIINDKTLFVEQFPHILR